MCARAWGSVCEARVCWPTGRWGFRSNCTGGRGSPGENVQLEGILSGLETLGGSWGKSAAGRSQTPRWRTGQPGWNFSPR